MPFELLFTKTADSQLKELELNASQKKRYNAVHKCIALLQINPKHPGLNTHKYYSLIGKNNEPIFEAYAENKTPAAYRIFWHYGPSKNFITIVAITAHP